MERAARMSIRRISPHGTRRCSTTGPIFLSRCADGQSLASIGGYANQQMVTAESVGANTSAFLTSISSDHRSALRVRIHPVGFLERLQRRNQQQRSTRVRGSRRSAALGRRRSDNGWGPSDNRHGHLHRPCHRQYRQRELGSHLSRRRHILRPRSTSAPATARSISTASTEPTTPARPMRLQRRRPRSEAC